MPELGIVGFAVLVVLLWLITRLPTGQNSSDIQRNDPKHPEFGDHLFVALDQESATECRVCCYRSGMKRGGFYWYMSAGHRAEHFAGGGKIESIPEGQWRDLAESELTHA